MGKQINFFMTNKVKADFISFLMDEGFIFITDDAYVDDYIVDYNDIGNIMNCICLHKPKYGKLIADTLVYGKMSYINKSYNPVIEFWIPRIDFNKRKIKSGRIWVTSDQFYDDNAQRTVILKDYNKLVRWIKKNVPYQNVDGYSQKVYISNDLVDLVYNDGYILR